MMSKMQLIERISQMNRSARAEFLAEFNEAELQQYLGNLETVWSEFQAQYYRTTDGVAHSETESFEPALMAG
jgi:hypothetical protein